MKFIRNELERLEEVVGANPGITAAGIAEALGGPLSLRTLQFRLKRLVDQGRVQRDGERRWARYRVEGAVPLSPESQEIRTDLRDLSPHRTPSGYSREFLDGYRPGETFYLPANVWVRLSAAAARSGAAPGLLVDLSWNSSRLEGNAYSPAEARRLIEFGQEADGRSHLDAQMILNHKAAVEFLIRSGPDIGFNRHTILNLHAILANNLLADERTAGRLRHGHADEALEESFERLLETASAITDPFEQSFFVLTQLPYLRPFEAVNARVSRLAANIPFIRANLSPLTFTDLPRALYADAMSGVSEFNRIDLLRDVFVWSYERSADRYGAEQQSTGEPNSFRLRHRDALRTVVTEVVQRRLDRPSASVHIATWVSAHLDEADRDGFREVAEHELLGLHDGNFARYPITAAEFAAWAAHFTT